MSRDDARLTEDDLVYFLYRSEQLRLAQPVIERDYDRLAATDDTWVVFLDGKLMAASSDHQELENFLAAHGARRDRYLIRFLPCKDKIFVLHT